MPKEGKIQSNFLQAGAHWFSDLEQIKEYARIKHSEDNYLSEGLEESINRGYRIILTDNAIKTFKCPDCAADVKLEDNELKFIKHKR